jgi:Domain of unknown function (DUF6249)
VDEDVFIPITLFLSVAVVVSLYYWFRYRARGEMQLTIRTAIEKGQELSPEIIDRLGHPKAPRDRDLRLALLWLALAIGLALCGWAVPDPSGYALRGVLAGAAFPFCIGVAYLIMWRFTDRNG